MHISRTLITTYANKKIVQKCLLCPLMNVLKYYYNYLDCECFLLWLILVEDTVCSVSIKGIIFVEDTESSGRHDGPRPPSPSPTTRRLELRSLLGEFERIVERLRTKNERALQRSGELHDIKCCNVNGRHHGPSPPSPSLRTRKRELG
ncbi:hypothetical protein CEXT_421021 [Caerostris extrusa]|uniref:Uncharacterized protein n=1 Tax=Caerostris extrusa TaxID=172846 RepID=A0AAV4S385_CAEEX|nr:hypothetical protein CEXT_421021 [Caerostris extrusa]